MNYMDKISKVLGLKLGEDFKIAGMDGEFWLDDDIGSLLTVKSGRIYRTEEKARAHVEEDKAFWRSIREELVR